MKHREAHVKEKNEDSVLSHPRSAPLARLLVIRFSSFGDIVQACSIPAAFQSQYRDAEVDWLVRADFAPLLVGHRRLTKVIQFNRAEGLGRLARLAWRLAHEGGYTHVYDAHCNLRSRLVMVVFILTSWLRAIVTLGTARPPKFLTRSKERFRRWLYFQWRLKVLPEPFRGAMSFLWPLGRWGIPSEMPQGVQFWTDATLPSESAAALQELPRPLIALAPSAAWEMKRWPIENWKGLVAELPEAGFVLIGGPADQFISEIASVAPARCLNLAGRLDLQQSAACLGKVDLVIANDTGILHVADQMERPTLALIGPTAFGYPSHATSQTLEFALACKPCSKDGRGKCRNSLYQRCLVEILPQRVASAAREILSGVSKP